MPTLEERSQLDWEASGKAWLRGKPELLIAQVFQNVLSSIINLLQPLLRPAKRPAEVCRNNTWLH